MTPFALHLLRHGAPALPGRLMGRTDVAPTAEGVAACANQAATLDFGQLVTSDLRRALASAEAIARISGRTAKIDARWRELDFGEWDGLTPTDVAPAAIGRFWKDPDANPPPGGERWSALAARVEDAIAALVPMDTLVVTHGGAIRAALHLLCGFEQRQLWSFDLPYGVLVSLRVWPRDQLSGQITGIVR